MARRQRNKEINVFSTSAIDLFASGMGVFLILMVVALPRFANTSKSKIEMDMESENVSDLVTEVNKLTQINSQFLAGLTAQMKNLGKIDSQIQLLASIGKSARTKVEGVQNVAETLQATQSIVKDLSNTMKVINQGKIETEKKLEDTKKQLNKIKKKIIKLAKENKKSKEQGDMKLTLGILLNWETPLHDIDLWVTDSDGVKHSFKEKSPYIPSDSRIGPGAEVWLLKNPKPGKYKVEAYFHGSYGNKEPAQVSLSLLDSTGVKFYPKQKLGKETESKVLIEFEVGKNSSIINTGAISENRVPAQEK